MMDKPIYFIDLPGVYASTACLWEATARKPGNVHRTANLPGLDYTDFLLSAVVVGPVLNRAAEQSLGETVFAAISATRWVVRTNTNLGTVLLLAPLAAVPLDQPLAEGVLKVLAATTVEDARYVFKAIRLAQAGGLGQVAEQDISRPPTLPLREVMALAADRDLIALQYVNGFRYVFDQGISFLTQGLEIGALEEAIIFTHLQFMAHFPDSLIGRKLGQTVAEESARRAKQVVDEGWPETSRAQMLLGALDVWLRGDGNKRNPGTSADMVAATLFVALRDGLISLPTSLPWSAGFIS